MKKQILSVGLALISSLNAADIQEPAATSCPLEILGLASQDDVQETDNVYSFPKDAPFLHFMPCAKEAPKKSRAVARIFAAGIVIMHVQYERDESYNIVKYLFMDRIRDSDLLESRIQADDKLYERILDMVKKDYSPFKKNQPQLDDVRCAIIWYSLHAESMCTYSPFYGAMSGPEFETKVNRLLYVFNSIREKTNIWKNAEEILCNKINPNSNSEGKGEAALVMQQKKKPHNSMVTCHLKDLFTFLNDKNKNLLEQEAKLLHNDLQTRRPPLSEDKISTLTPQAYGNLDEYQTLPTQLLVDKLKAKLEQAAAKRSCNVM